MTLGIDASTPGSGGAKRHLIELLNCFEPGKHGFSLVKIWGVDKILLQLPDSANIKKLSHPYLNKGFFHRVIWQLFFRDSAFKGQFDILFSPFGTYTGKIRPKVSMSRNMLIFDKKERRRFGLSWMRLKLTLLHFKQKKAFRNSQALIFLSQYARDRIGEVINLKGRPTKIIHHGVSDNFRFEPKKQYSISSYDFKNPFKLLYVSSIWVYKHPWNVVSAINGLRKKGVPIVLEIIGTSEQISAAKKLTQVIRNNDPTGDFISWHKNVNLDEVSLYYKRADAFVFASTCENMPNILIEAMSSGLPVACSSYGPMPEFLKDGGLYFDPTNINEIETVLEKMLHSPELRSKLSALSFKYAKEFTWRKCADQTFSFLQQIKSNQIDKENVQ